MCGDHNVRDEEKIPKTGYGKSKGITGFDTERPLVYDFDEIAEATNNFDDTRIIGEGGYGSVYFGILGESNILLDKGLRAKVPSEYVLSLYSIDFGLAKLVGRTNDDDFIATRLVGTPGYLPPKLTKQITKVFKEEEDPEGALVSVRDGSLRDGYSMDGLYKMAEISYWCLSEDPNNRPKIQEVVESLARIVMSSVEWEASLGGSSQVFSGVFDGR
ncbi:LysM domain receptor-like kinase 3 [Tanacetum coccineum]